MTASSWRDGVNGDWADGSAWSTGVVPGSADDVTIAASGTYTIAISAEEAARSLTLAASAATVNDSARLALGGALLLSAGTFVLEKAGTVQGGTLSTSGGTFAWQDGTLSGATYRGTLDLSHIDAQLVVSGGIRLQGTGGIGAGRVELTGAYSALTVLGSATLDRARIDIGASGYSALYSANSGSSAVLTLGAHFKLVQAGASAVLQDANAAGDGIVNRGTISLGRRAGQFIIQGNSFANAGIVRVNNGDSLTVGSTGFSNTGAITVSGTGSLLTANTVTGAGTLAVGSGATLHITGLTAGQQSVDFAGPRALLRLDQPASFAGLLGNFAPADTLSIGSAVATTAMIGGGTLDLTLSNGASLAYTLTGSPDAERTAVSADGHNVTAYRLAQCSVLTPVPVAFGVVHVGDGVSQSLLLANTATADGYSEALDASLSGSGGIVAFGTLSLLAAGASGGGSLEIGLATGVSGIISGAATLSTASDGSGVDGLAPTALGSQGISVTGTVDAYAVAAMTQVSGPGSLTQSGSAYILQLGTVQAGSGFVSAGLGVVNAANGLADLLSGSFSVAGSSAFTNGGLVSFSGLGSGQADTAPSVSLATSAAGTFSETIVLQATGSNAGGYAGALAPETLTVTGTVAGPPTAALVASVDKGTGTPAGYTGLTASGALDRQLDSNTSASRCQNATVQLDARHLSLDRMGFAGALSTDTDTVTAQPGVQALGNDTLIRAANLGARLSDLGGSSSAGDLTGIPRAGQATTASPANVAAQGVLSPSEGVRPSHTALLGALLSSKLAPAAEASGGLLSFHW